MPEARLERTREAYRVPMCGHVSQIGDRYREVLDAQGVTTRERIPQRFVTHSTKSWYCRICGQFVEE